MDSVSGWNYRRFKLADLCSHIANITIKFTFRSSWSSVTLWTLEIYCYVYVNQYGGGDRITCELTRLNLSSDSFLDSHNFFLGRHAVFYLYDAFHYKRTIPERTVEQERCKTRDISYLEEHSILPINIYLPPYIYIYI